MRARRVGGAWRKRENLSRCTDRYRGSIQNRVRFIFAVIATVIDVVGADGVGVRLSSSLSGVGSVYYDNEKSYEHAISALAPLEPAHFHPIEPLPKGTATHDDTEPAEFSAMRASPPLRPDNLIAGGGFTASTGSEIVIDVVSHHQSRPPRGRSRDQRGRHRHPRPLSRWANAAGHQRGLIERHRA
ncbi:hypothetical protein [Nocardia asiatica]|uniref:oxidoreductase n=1 Tax=Nocardia asiatica TaxID=209252 RepID=UPI003EE21F0E